MFPEVLQRFHSKKAPLLHSLIEEYNSGKRAKLSGLSVLHNVPITLSTLLKIEALVASGVSLTVTLPKFVSSDPKAVALLRASSIEFIPEHENIDFNRSFDVVLDCCAELSGRVTPRLGSVELTQTGDKRFQALPIDYPVVSVDNSCVKRIEDAIGSADGFMRALDKYISEPLEGKRFLLFGYGKVGVGIASRLKEAGVFVTVVDISSRLVEVAKERGYDSILADNIAGVEEAARKAFCAVTATGTVGIVSDKYEPAAFQNCKYKVNIGTHDEFGSGFKEEDVLFNKRPVNFALEEPTTIQYLDPAFYSHNLGVELLKAGGFSAGVHPLPLDSDRDILKRWLSYHDAAIVKQATSILEQVGVKL